MRDAYDAGTAAGYATGTGVDQPMGILPALDAATGVDIAPGTASTITPADLFKIVEAVPIRSMGPLLGGSRPRGRW